MLTGLLNLLTLSSHNAAPPLCSDAALQHAREPWKTGLGVAASSTLFFKKSTCLQRSQGTNSLLTFDSVSVVIRFDFYFS